MPEPLCNAPRHVFEPLAEHGQYFGNRELSKVAQALERRWAAMLDPALDVVKVGPCSGKVS
jgi:hypothetical protein